MDKQFYLVDCKGIQIEDIQKLLLVKRMFDIPIINNTLDQILELRRNNREQIKIIYIKSPLSMRYENIRKENNNTEQSLSLAFDDTMIERKMVDIADLVVVNYEGRTIANIVDEIWQFVRKEKGSD